MKKSLQTEFLLHQVQLSKRKWKYEEDILIGFSFSPVQNELLHRDCFSNSSNSFSEHSSDGLIFKDVVTFDGCLLYYWSPGCSFNLSDLMFIIDLSTPTLCDVQLCVDLIQKFGGSRI